MQAVRTSFTLAALGVVTVAQGAIYLALGQLRASELVQYLPYPVVCGCLGVTALFEWTRFVVWVTALEARLLGTQVDCWSISRNVLIFIIILCFSVSRGRVC